MRRLATALTVCALAGCSSETSTAPAGEEAPAQANTPPASAPAPTSQAGAAAPSGSAAPAAMDSTVTAPASSTPPAIAPAMQVPPTAASTPTTTTMPATPAAGGKKLAMDECGLHTPYDGDEYCILPPPPDKGFQIHIGPSNYDNPEPEYLLQPGEENVVDMSTTSGNDKPVYYYYRQYRMRPGSHHVIVTGNGRRLGGTQNLAKDNPDFGEIPDENKHIGLPLDAHATINLNLHYYNFTDKPIIREVWVNFWYKDESEVKERAREVFSPTTVNAAVARSHVVVGASCPVTAEARLLSLYGHRHLNNVRFSVFHKSGAGERQLVLEDYESEHPSVFEFNSLAKNELPDPAKKRPGAISGILNIKPGDTIDFECEIINMTDKNFTGANEAADDEMCILVGDAVGGGLGPFCTPMQAKQVTN